MNMIVTISIYVEFKHGGFLSVFVRIFIFCLTIMTDYWDVPLAMEAISPKLQLSLLWILWLTTHWANSLDYFGKGVHN